ncbi:hypothetical protein [Nostoc sp. ATCC 53789]|uniref:hypothetical protein n=1 Tax=Nostoc sp. ATCC 53789 TaxID=76335 RepID=UPI00143078A2|nr:hypothetical protein [Nostoc sp. ATCC 53789]
MSSDLFLIPLMAENNEMMKPNNTPKLKVSRSISAIHKSSDRHTKNCTATGAEFCSAKVTAAIAIANANKVSIRMVYLHQLI